MAKQHDYMISLNRIMCRGARIRDMNLTIVMALLRENHKSKEWGKILKKYAKLYWHLELELLGAYSVTWKTETSTLPIFECDCTSWLSSWKSNVNGLKEETIPHFLD